MPRENIKVYVVRDGVCGVIPDVLVDAVAWMQSRLESIPPEFRASATFEITTEGGYDSGSYAEVEIAFRRPETDGEMAAREKQEELRRMGQEIRDRYDLNRLTKKLSAKS